MNHLKQWNLLKNTIKSGRLAHALLFYGQKGLGKKSFALKFSEELLGCKNKNLNPDFIFLDSEEQIKISQIKEIANKLSFKPYSSPCKIAVINNVHLMNKEAQNCFLKFLEEPTPKTYLILITQYPNLLLPTVLSRLQKVRFYLSKDFKLKRNEEFAYNVAELNRLDLAERFKIAKELAEGDLSQILDEWLLYFREILLLKLKKEKTAEFSGYSLLKIKEIIEKIQTAKFLVSSTNINPKLTLENLFLKI